MGLVSPTTWKSRPRRLVGLMSGTSLDGIDAVLVEVAGGIPFDTLRVEGFLTRPFTSSERARIAELLQSHVSLPALLTANVWLGELFAETALQVIAAAGLVPDKVDAIASHGQTIWHLPPQGSTPGATMQIGEPSVIAQRTGVLTVADFRPRDMADGGQGAPLVPFADHLLFPHVDRAIAVQNIGGIGNVTWLPRGGDPDGILAFDTGPGNMVIDAVVEHYGRGAFDRDGAIAAAGQVNQPLLHELLLDDYFCLPPPKSTGREHFGAAYVAAVIARAEHLGLSVEETVATVTALTANSIARAYRDFLPETVDQVILGGGGSYNHTLRRMIAECLPGILVNVHEDVGISGEAKEAIAFALLGYATLCAVPNNVPSATGAATPVIMGKIIPGRD